MYSFALPFLLPAAFLLEGSRVAGRFLGTARRLGARTSEAAGLGNPAAWLRRPDGGKEGEGSDDKTRCGTHLVGGQSPPSGGSPPAMRGDLTRTSGAVGHD